MRRLFVIEVMGKTRIKSRSDIDLDRRGTLNDDDNDNDPNDEQTNETGRDCGYLSMLGAVCSGAEKVLLPGS